MEYEFLLLSLAVFGAATLQAATGIGFGVIAGPVLLVVLNDNAAIQVSIFLNLLIALLLAPSLRQSADRRLLSRLLKGAAIGSPLGLLIYLSMDIGMLKAFAGIVVIFTLIFVVRGRRAVLPTAEPATGKFAQLSIGAIAGVMGGSLAMPGPVPAAWMSATGYRKETIRATILLMFVFAYAIALVLQYSLAGIDGNTLWLCIVYAPATIAGVLSGRVLSSRISEQTFRWLLMIVLGTTGLILFATIG
ncbi:MAG: sulfite exporter TauE/SafE family protein [Gammaproteobacteria bacterium]|nr:sulfite exporter TauE/SafE family protein [Gammaproteobacteria bacterium]